MHYNYAMLQCSYLTCHAHYAHKKPFASFFYQVGMVYVPVVMVLYKDGDQHVNKSTNNDHFVVTSPSFMYGQLNPSYMLALCLMLAVTHCVQNYAGIIGLGLVRFSDRVAVIDVKPTSDK